jgi:hypothetical protein
MRGHAGSSPNSADSSCAALLARAARPRKNAADAAVLLIALFYPAPCGSGRLIGADVWATPLYVDDKSRSLNGHCLFYELVV